MNRPLQQRAFSILELLTVIALIAILTTLVAPSFSNLGRANLLSTSGNKVVNLINYAGQNSLAKNAMTALIALAPDSGKNYTVFTLMEYAPNSGEWKQLSGWETLRDGIVVDQINFSDYSSQDPATKPQPDLPAIKYQGRTYSDYKYLVFLPNRSLLQNTSAQIRFAEGSFAPGAEAPTYSRRGSDGSPANYYAVTVLGATGRPKIDRP